MPDVIDNVDIDDDEDLSKLPRGDDFVPPDDKDKSAKPEGGDPEGGDPEGGDPEGGDPEGGDPEGGDPEGGDPEGGDPEGGDPEGGDPEGGDPEGGDPDDVKTLKFSRAKALRQRDEANQRLEQMERELATLRNAGKPADDATVDPVKALNEKLDSLYEKVESQRADTDIKGAAATQREIDSINREIGRLESEATAGKVTAKQLDNVKFDAYLDIIESARPDVKKGSEEYDPTVAREFATLVKAYEGLGMPGSVALQKASVLLLQLDPQKPTVKDGGTKEKTPDKPDGKKPDPKKPDPKKAVETQRKQPPDASDRGANKDGAKIRVDQLSDEDLDALPASKIAQLRGDHRV